jgi:hypothetical protein
MFLKTLSPGACIVARGCASAHAVYRLAENGFDETAIDFSIQAFEIAQRSLGRFADSQTRRAARLLGSALRYCMGNST